MTIIRLKARTIINLELNYVYRIMKENEFLDALMFHVATKRFNKLLKVSAYLTDKELAD